MIDDITRPLPHALGPEKSVLSSMLQDPQDFIPLALEENITADYFYMPNHALLFEILVESFQAGEEIEFVSMVQRMLDRGQLDRLGGPSALADIHSYSHIAGHFRHHLQHVKDKFILRSIIRVANESIAATYDAPDDPQEALATLDRGLTAIEGAANGSRPILTRKELLRASFEQYERRVRGETDSVGMATYPALDRHIRGLHPGRLYVIGAFPGGGKSTMSSEIVSHLVMAGTPCAYIPLEGSEDDVITRAIIQTAGVVAMAYTDPKKFAQETDGKEVTKIVMARIQTAIKGLIGAPLHIRRPQTPSVLHIIALIRRLVREEQIKLVVVDYAQRIKATGKFEGGDGAAKECSNALQDLAIELGIAIIVPSQLTESGDTKHGKVWGEDADVVLRIVQDMNKESETYKQHRFIMIDKDRQNGSSGERVQLILDRPKISFAEGRDETSTQKKKSFQR